MKAFVESFVTSPSTNPLVGILYGGADAIATDVSAKEKVKMYMNKL